MHTEKCPSINISVNSGINASILEEDLALSSSTHGTTDKTSGEVDSEYLDNFKEINKVVYLNEDTMDCTYSETIKTPRKMMNNFYTNNNEQVSSPEMFASDDDDDDDNNKCEASFRKLLSQPTALPAPSPPKNPPKLTDEQLILQSDCYLFTRVKKFLTGIPPPPKHTVYQNDCLDFLNNIKKNRKYFWTDPFLDNDKSNKNDNDDIEDVTLTVDKDKSDKNDSNDVTLTVDKDKSEDKNVGDDVTLTVDIKNLIKEIALTNDSNSNSNINNNEDNNLLKDKSTSLLRPPSMRNLINAFDACEQASTSNLICQSEESTITLSNEYNNTRISSNTNSSSPISSKNINSPCLITSESTFSVTSNTNSNSNSNFNTIIISNFEDIKNNKQVTFNVPSQDYLGIFTTINDQQAKSLPWPVIYKHKAHGIHYNRNRYIEEFENISVKLCQRYIGNETQSTCTSWFTKQAPGSAKKRSLLNRRAIGQSPGKRLSHLARRRTTFSSANLQGMAEKKQLIVNVRKPIIKKGKSPRRKSPRSSTKKRLVRRLSLEGPSPRKSKIETSKRALFQSPTSESAGPSRINTINNPQKIKRALFPTPQKKEDDLTRKRKLDDHSEVPKVKWARSLTFDCTRSLDRYSTGSSIHKKSESQQVKSDSVGLSDIHRKKLWWAVYEALRSKGVTMSHPKFKEYASQLAKTVRKYMPDLENRNIPRKPGSTSDRMLKLAKSHVLLFVDTKVNS